MKLTKKEINIILNYCNILDFDYLTTNLDNICNKFSITSMQLKRLLNKNNIKYKKDLYCIVCGSQILGQGDKYCNKECYYKDRKGFKHSEETKKKMSISNSGKDNSSRGEAISSALISNRYILTNDDKEKIHYFLSQRYISNIHILMELTGIFHRGVLQRYIDENNLYEKYKVLKYLEKKVQNWSIEKMNQFKSDISIYDHITLKKKYKITTTFYRLCDLFSLDYKRRNKGYLKNRSKIEIIVENFLIEHNLIFKSEHYINNNTWRLDFLVNDNIAIEVHGDYWHANPRVFGMDNLNDMQKKNILRDRYKKQWCLDNGYRYIEIWEKDIYDDKKNTFKKLLQEITNE